MALHNLTSHLSSCTFILLGIPTTRIESKIILINVNESFLKVEGQLCAKECVLASLRMSHPIEDRIGRQLERWMEEEVRMDVS